MQGSMSKAMVLCGKAVPKFECVLVPSQESGSQQLKTEVDLGCNFYVQAEVWVASEQGYWQLDASIISQQRLKFNLGYVT